MLSERLHNNTTRKHEMMEDWRVREMEEKAAHVCSERWRKLLVDAGDRVGGG